MGSKVACHCLSFVEVGINTTSHCTAFAQLYEHYVRQHQQNTQYYIQFIVLLLPSYTLNTMLFLKPTEDAIMLMCFTFH